MGKRAPSTRPSETPQDNTAVREQKPTVSHKRRTSSTSQPAKSDTTMDKSVKSNLENKERAYVAASRRMDRSLEDRLKSAHQASEVHFQRTGKRFKITKENVEKGLWYDEIDDLPRHRLAEHTMDYQTRARYQEVDEQFNQVFGSVMPRVQAYPAQFTPAYSPYPPSHMSSMPMQLQMPVYSGVSKPLSQSPSFASQQSFGLDNMQYPYGPHEYTPRQRRTRRSISPASNSSATSREPAASVSPVSMGTSSNPTSPESEIDSSAAEIMASASRHNSFGHFSASNSPMLSQELSFQNFMTAAPNSSPDTLAQAIDPELHGSPTAYFANMSFDDMGSDYTDFVTGYDFREQSHIAGDGPNKETFVASDTSPVASVDNWDDLLNPSEFEDVGTASQGSQGWERQA
ncbi:hypothetical protein QC762_508660 [Podospora pseudocomata]|uniref:MADS-box domain-containing protein n=1 Tax=Podospora pseudocomata TaxID=2093779 RepID=A0ABR0GDC4_9PEZI|nr:hypothetical protein QC762_508660 [Podospora pseudocomata]